MPPRVGLVATPEQAILIIPVLQAVNFQVTALYCKNSHISLKLASKFDIPYSAKDFKDLLFRVDVDLVYVATEPARQAEVAVKALTSGKHCICQKPPTICQAEAQKMVGLSQYYSRLLSLLDNHLRFLPAVQKLKKLLSEGYCGKLLVMEAHVRMGSLIQDEDYSWKCESSMGGGALNIVGAHLIDLVTFLSGQHAFKAHATLSTFSPSTNYIRGYRTIASDDFCCFHLRYNAGLYATVILNTHTAGQFDFQFSVTGTCGHLAIQGLDLLGSREGRKVAVLHKQEEPDLQKFGLKDCTKCPKLYLLHHVLGYQKMLEALKQTFEHPQYTGASGPATYKAPPDAATFEDGLYIRTVLDTLHTSNAIGKWVDVPKARKVDPSNPFWTSTSQLQQTVATNADKSSPKPQRPVYV